MKRKLYYETVTIGSPACIIASTCTNATPAQIKKAKAEFKAGKCKHHIIYDEAGWPYDIRSCGICGQGLGLI